MTEMWPDCWQHVPSCDGQAAAPTSAWGLRFFPGEQAPGLLSAGALQGVGEPSSSWQGAAQGTAWPRPRHCSASRQTARAVGIPPTPGQAPGTRDHADTQADCPGLVLCQGPILAWRPLRLWAAAALAGDAAAGPSRTLGTTRGRRKGEQRSKLGVAAVTTELDTVGTAGGQGKEG